MSDKSVVIPAQKEIKLGKENIVSEKTGLTPSQQKLLDKYLNKPIAAHDDPKIAALFEATAAKLSPLQAKFERQTVDSIAEMGKIVDDLFRSLPKGLPIAERWKKGGFPFSYSAAINYRNIANFKSAVLKDQEWFEGQFPGKAYPLARGYEVAREANPEDQRKKKVPQLTSGSGVDEATAPVLIVGAKNEEELAKIAELIQKDVLDAFDATEVKMEVCKKSEKGKFNTTILDTVKLVVGALNTKLPVLNADQKEGAVIG